MIKLDKINGGNAQPATKDNKLVVAEDYNKVVDKVNETIDVVITNEGDTYDTVPSIVRVVTLTELDYAEIETKDPNTWYLIATS